MFQFLLNISESLIWKCKSHKVDKLFSLLFSFTYKQREIISVQLLRNASHSILNLRVGLILKVQENYEDVTEIYLKPLIFLFFFSQTLE